MTENNWIGIILPTKDGKYMMAKATIKEDKTIESLKDAVISVSDVEGKKEDLKYPFVLLQDIEILKQKLIEDIKNEFYETQYSNYQLMKYLINKRFWVEGK